MRQAFISRMIMIGYAVVIAITILLSTINIVHAQYGHYSSYSGSNGFASYTINKDTSSSVYVKHYGQTAAWIQVRSNGVSYSSNVFFPVNTPKYITNSVYENGRRNCYLYIKPSSGSAMLYGDWYSDV